MPLQPFGSVRTLLSSGGVFGAGSCKFFFVDGVPKKGVKIHSARIGTIRSQRERERVCDSLQVSRRLVKRVLPSCLKTRDLGGKNGVKIGKD